MREDVRRLPRVCDAILNSRTRPHQGVESISKTRPQQSSSSVFFCNFRCRRLPHAPTPCISNSSQHGEPRGLSVPGRAAGTSPSSSPIPRGAHGIQLVRGTKDLHRIAAQRPRPPQCSKSEALKGLSAQDRTDICPSSSSRVPGAGSRTRSIQGLFPRSFLCQPSMESTWREKE